MALSHINDPVGSDLTLPRIDGGRQWLRPFRDVATKIAFRQKYIQLASAWEPLPLDSIHPTEAGFYLVEETPPQGDAVFRWLRTYAKIPEPRSISEAYQFYRPAFEGGTAAGAVQSIAGTPTNINNTTEITMASGHTLEVGDSVEVVYTVYIPGVGQQSRTIYRTVLAVASPDLTVDLITDANVIISWGTVQAVDPDRSSKSVLAATEVEYSYVLPGVTPGIQTVDDITIIHAFEGRGSSGGLTNSLSSTTSPTSGTYQNWIGSRTRIVMEGTTIRRWLGSNIREVSTRYGFAL